nr:nucleotidyltransferase family protein [Litorivivens lipolytica]
MASGASRRFGSDKRLAKLPSGMTLLEHMLEVVERSQIPYRVTVRRGDALILNYALELDRAAEGMGGSIAEAVACTRDDFDALMILPVDLPLLCSDTLKQLAAGVSTNTLRRPTYRGQSGHPVVFGRDYFDELAALNGEGGAQSVLQEHHSALELIPVSDRGICCDIDTPEALQQLIDQGALSAPE